MNLPLVGVYSVLFAVAWSAFCWVYRTLLTWSPHNRLGKAVSYFGGAVVVGVGMMMFSIVQYMDVLNPKKQMGCIQAFLLS